LHCQRRLSAAEKRRSSRNNVNALKCREPGHPAFVTLIANYIPRKDWYGGLNYFTINSDGIYETHVDNNGDAVEELTFRFKFKQTSKDIFT